MGWFKCEIMYMKKIIASLSFTIIHLFAFIPNASATCAEFCNIQLSNEDCSTTTMFKEGDTINFFGSCHVTCCTPPKSNPQEDYSSDCPTLIPLFLCEIFFTVFTAFFPQEEDDGNNCSTSRSAFLPNNYHLFVLDAKGQQIDIFFLKSELLCDGYPLLISDRGLDQGYYFLSPTQEGPMRFEVVANTGKVEKKAEVKKGQARIKSSPEELHPIQY